MAELKQKRVPTGTATKERGDASLVRSSKPLTADDRRERCPVWERTWFLAFTGAVLLWGAFPPLDLWPLAYVAVVPWVLLIRRPMLTGRRPYLVIYAAALVHWLMLLQGIRLAHGALYFGWFALSAFVACYTPVMIACGRVMVHRLRLPLVIAAPVAWVGIELIRGYVISGFSLGLLAHTQVQWTSLLQVADVGGAYAVSFLVVLVAAGLADLMPIAGELSGAWSRRWKPLGIAAAVMGVALGYGFYRLNEDSAPEDGGDRPVRVGLIQGSLDTVFDVTPERIQETFEQYGDLTRQVRAQESHLDLVVWPESMFPIPERVLEEPLHSPPGSDIPPENLRQLLVEGNKHFEGAVAQLNELVQPKPSAGGGDADQSGTYAVLGTNTIEYGPYAPRLRNAALLIEPSGQIAGRYYKMHAVMCGEYLPLGDLLPWVYGLTPMAAGLTVGEQPAVFEVRGKRFSPSICFESTVPHLIRGQVNEL
jgi:apolipoprotein N-acyltransferase